MIASSAQRPMPSMSKMYSVNTVPPSSVPKSRPKIVTTGMIAARSACRKTTTFSFWPLATAVRM